MRQRPRFFLLALLALPVGHAQAGQEASLSPDKAWKVVTSCKGELGSECTVFAQSASANAKTWLQRQPFPSQPGVKWLSASMAQVTYSCGSPCSAAQFFSPPNNASKLFADAIAVDTKRALVAVAGESPTNKAPAILVFHIFGSDKPLAVIVRDFGPAAALASAIQEASFTSSGQLKLKYQSGPNAQLKQETIAIAE